MNCPRHNKELEHRIVENHSVYRCPECAGMWLPGNAIDEALGSGEKLKLRSLCSARESKLVCPNDEKVLGEGKIGTVTVDLCLGCNGLWLDWGELETLQKRKGITPHKKQEKDGPLVPANDDGTLAVITMMFLGF